ncbi:hypothetical protein HNQ94_001462 [Salirhabdus euzebyi]|uniref:Uncharacterized protein n=1 Tax=Salirhabdus euzebyi TaxID=394506 RepID=A0A841Q3P4_9BACI|nr:hypothetical protein [Salirhabdus euzebyi]MBB6453014.1 hypothetical protein [Salirhabdus euzebyi]
MDTFLSWIKKQTRRIIEWGKRKYASFMVWLTSSEVDQFLRRNRYRSFVFLLLTPIFVLVPIFTLLGSFELISFHFYGGLMLFLFSLCCFFVFVGFPYIMLFVYFSKHTYWRTIQISSGVVVAGLFIYWGVTFYQTVLPSL